ncbi:MAG: hypothetical protein AAF394_09195 [Planctomycetota bacterium]
MAAKEFGADSQTTGEAMQTGLLSARKTYAPSSLPRVAWLAILLALFGPSLLSAQETRREGTSSRSARTDAQRRIPYKSMRRSVVKQVQSVVDNPSFFRRMPTEEIACDPDLFTFMVRRPEVMVNIWQVMGITKVTAKRVNDFTFVGNDGAGTICRCTLIYASRGVHIYYGEGSYDGSLSPRKVTGSCVCVLKTQPVQGADGANRVRGTMDVFMKLDSFGADLVARSVAPFIGKTADYNFVETAKFIGQISQVCEQSPVGAKNLAARLKTITPEARDEFARIVTTIGNRQPVADSRFSSALASQQQFKRLPPQVPDHLPPVVVPQKLESSRIARQPNEALQLQNSVANTSRQATEPPTPLAAGGEESVAVISWGPKSRPAVQPTKAQIFLRR